MKKNSVPMAAIELIVKLREDRYKSWGYLDIANELKKQFNIEITRQGVGYLYRTHKDNPQIKGSIHVSNIDNETVVIDNQASQKDEALTVKATEAPKPFVKKNLTNKRDFTQVSDEDFKNLLKGDE